jgi:threonine dehydrogenase-like Zn-dependent dehydrogenase
MAQVLASTGCRLQVVGRNPRTLEFCEKKGIQPIHVDNVIPKMDQDLIVECSGNQAGLAMALQMVRPRGTVVLKSTCAEPWSIDLSPAVVNEVTLLGSRCGPFAEAVDALARKQIDVLSMISRIVPLNRASEAFEAAEASGNIKVLLEISKG